MISAAKKGLNSEIDATSRYREDFRVARLKRSIASCRTALAPRTAACYSLKSDPPLLLLLGRPLKLCDYKSNLLQLLLVLREPLSEAFLDVLQPPL